MLTLIYKLGCWASDMIWKKKGQCPNSPWEPGVGGENDSMCVLKEGNGNMCPDLETKVTVEINGIVTSVHGDYGLANEHIYFKLKDVFGGQVPRRGDKVRFKMKDMDAKQAECVQIVTEDWDNGPQGQTGHTDSDAEEDADMPFAKIAKVTSVDKNLITVDESFKCVIRKDKHKGFEPVVGDWVSIRAEEGKESDKVPTVDMKPLREKTLDGTVSWQHFQTGAIDNEIYFLPEACVNGYRPQVGDRVRVTAIESSYNNYEWRAVTLIPKFGRAPYRRPQHANLRPVPGSGYVPAEMEDQRDTKGITVVPGKTVDFGIVRYGKKVYQSVWIKNNGEEARTLVNCRVADSGLSVFTVTEIYSHDKCGGPNGERKFQVPGEVLPGCEVDVAVTCHAMDPGLHQRLLQFEFDGFVITRHLTADVSQNPQGLPNKNGKFNTRVPRSRNFPGNENTTVIPGVKLINRRMVRLPVYLQQYPVPQHLIDFSLNGTELIDVMPWLAEDLTKKNHEQKFSTLLFLEEIQVALNLARHDIERAVFERRGEYLTLEVPGLADGSPSLVLGDRVHAMDPHDLEGPTYEGWIHDISGETLFLRFDPGFHNMFRDMTYYVRFECSRGCYRRKHQALRLSDMFGESVLFPKKVTNSAPLVRFLVLDSECRHCDAGKAPTSLRAKMDICACKCHGDFAVTTSPDCESEDWKMATWFNPSLNTRQRVAVQRILQGGARPTPYALFGPPGTGKTVTVVETVLQVLHLVSHSRILVCAPSNSAADLLCERLHNSNAVSSWDMIRLNALHRNENSLPEDVRPYCSYGGNSKGTSRYRIIVGTCSTVGNLFNMGIHLGHFTHVFVDEAGQATEPECLVPLCLTVGSENAVMVLSGDPNQLGPVIQSRYAATYGLQVSLLERLLKSSPYSRNDNDDDRYNPLLVTKLVQNYRSHPAILKIYSGLFYEGELEVCAKKSDRECMCEWQGLPTKGFPVLFQATRGQELRESDCPSWFNPQEVLNIVIHVRAVYDCGVVPEELGIITPYRKQVEKIRLMLGSSGVPLPKIGSVEEFQGQERKVIIISTVRTVSGTCGPAAFSKIMFVGNPKRFNVMVSRAKALLLVIGDPYLLMNDKNWFALLQYCLDHGAIQGCDIEELKARLDVAK